MLTRRNLRRLTALAVGVLTGALAGTASASSTYPDIVKKTWNITGNLAGASAMGCTLCHQNDDGGFGTATRPFGKTMLSQHAIGATPDSLPGALNRDRSLALDSDGDKVSDYQELALDHTNPNDPKSFKLPPPPAPDAGGGGQGGDSGTDGGQGGQTALVSPPPYSAPPLEDLPPPFEHGCALAPAPACGGFAASLALALAAFARRRSRQRAT